MIKFTPEKNDYLCQNEGSICLLQNKVIKNVLFTKSKAVQAVKVKYFVIFLDPLAGLKKVAN